MTSQTVIIKNCSSCNKTHIAKMLTSDGVCWYFCKETEERVGIETE